MLYLRAIQVDKDKGKNKRFALLSISSLIFSPIMQTQRPSLDIYHGDNAGGRRKEGSFLEVGDVNVMLMLVYYMTINGDRKHLHSPVWQ